jgi:arachidonate 15-lipoxygenase
MTAVSLPQNDAESDKRVKALVAARGEYFYTFDKYPSLPMAAKLPKHESPPAEWSAVVNGALKVAVSNALGADKEHGSFTGGLSARAHEIAAAMADFARHHSVMDVVNDLSGLILAGDMVGRASSVDDYREFFRTIPTPALADHIHDDAFFSRKAVCGSNPQILARVREAHQVHAVTDGHLAQVSPGDSIERALAEGRLFIADYAMLDSLDPNTLGGHPRYVLAPRVYYVAMPKDRSLRVFAIELERTPGSPVFSTGDGWGWEIAKTHASVADTIAGALYYHHARAHIVAEPMVLSLHRHLADNHPLSILMKPHFMGTLYINEIGFKTVFAPHGALDWFTGASRDSVRQMIVGSVQSFDFDRSVLREELSSRGVGDAELLPDYPFRDDGVLVWDALASWVGEYVALYYSDDAAVLADVELQAWLAEVTAMDAGGLKGMGQSGKIRDRSYLIKMVTQIIFSGSAMHAAMNFPVKQEMAFVPNSPWAAYGDVPRKADGWSEQDWLNVLPPMGQAQRQFAVAHLLGESRYGFLGDYADTTFSDSRVAEPLARFRASLETVEATITERNLSRPDYIHMMPSRVPPSINI